MPKKVLKKLVKAEPAKKKDIPFNPHLQYKQAKANRAAKAAQEDTRFIKATYDPRYRDSDEQTSAINLQDERFNKVFNDAFNDEHEVDEYGRPTSKSNVEALADYYKLSKQEIKDKLKKKLEDEREYGGDMSGEIEGDEEQDEEAEVDDEEGEELSEDEEGSSDEMGSEEESSDDGEDIEDAMKRFLENADDDEEPERRDDPEAITSRLAIQNMDWSGFNSVDLLAVLHHFAPPGGMVKKVTIYPSELGKAAMAKEAIAGPEGIWKDTRDEAVKKAYQGLDEHKLRRYERNVLRYYYAIAECDSKKTASHIYDTCDGMEFEDSVNALDLRFVPDEQKFTNKPRDSATKIPDNYVAPAIFTKALGHSQQQLSWDKEDPKRAALLHADFSKKQLKDMSYEAFVDVINDDESDSDAEAENGGGEEDDADEEEGKEEESEGEEEEDEEEEKEDRSKKQNGKSTNGKLEKTKENGAKTIKEAKPAEKIVKKKVDPDERRQQKRNKYMSLLSGLYDKQPQKQELTISFDSNFDNNLASVSDDEEDESMEREVTFTPGLDEKAKEIMKQKELDKLSPWEKHLHKKADREKEVKEAKKTRAKEEMEKRKQDLRDSKTKKKTPETAEDLRKKEELELLVAGDKETETGFNMRQLANEEKNKEKKPKKVKKTKDEARQQDFAMDVSDPRFGAVFSNKEYGIDRSHPEYKKTANMKILENAITASRYDSTGAPKKDLSKKETQDEVGWDNSRLASLKRKIDSHPATSKQKQKQIKM